MLHKTIQKYKKGFTLVELIVVLTVLAILIALSVPAFSGYIKSQNRKDAISECRSCVLSAESLSNDRYASNAATIPGQADNSTILSTANVPSGSKILATKWNEGGKLAALDYESAKGIYILYENGTYTAQDTSPVNPGSLQADMNDFGKNYMESGNTFNRADFLRKFYEEFPQYATFMDTNTDLVKDLFPKEASAASFKWIAYPLIDSNGNIDVVLYATLNAPSSPDDFISSADSSTARSGNMLYYNGKIYYYPGKSTDKFGFGDPRNKLYTGQQMVDYVTKNKPGGKWIEYTGDYGP